jgi:two-component system, OmpR family, response regulator MprA
MPAPEILLVIPDSALLTETADTLENAAYVVARASNGAEGVQRILQKSPDLIITAIQMPIMDGFELLAYVRRTAFTAPIPVLLLCAPPEKERADGEYRNPDYFLQMPVSAERLLAAVRRAIGPR